jgi:hypothetical protein
LRVRERFIRQFLEGGFSEVRIQPSASIAS